VREPVKPRFFRDAARFRAWLKEHHASAGVLWVGYYRKDSGRPSITWPESVDEALCYGWIDGIRRRYDDVSYTIRFTPRRPGSPWSDVNIRRARLLITKGLMRSAGLRAFRARRHDRSAVPSAEQRGAEIAGPYGRLLRANRSAWKFFRRQAPFYRRATARWILSAKKEETRLRRLEKLIASSARGSRLM
jgi:uncharacterized protein YdeI (YjbR/CyaY-like superfamily)